jgi:integrase
MGAAQPFIQAQLDRLAKTRNGLDPERYLYESRKRADDGSSKPISRQQAWHALQLAMKCAGIAAKYFGTHSLRKTSAANRYSLSCRHLPRNTACSNILNDTLGFWRPIGTKVLRRSSWL